MELIDSLKSVVKRYYWVGIAVAVLMAALGVLILCFPQGTLVAVQWVLFVGFLAAGVFRILLYARLPYAIRPSTLLVIGVLDVVCSVAMIVLMIRSPQTTSASFQTMVGYMFGFYAVFAGVDTLCSCGFVRAIGGSVGWTVLSGLLYVAAGVSMLCLPVWSVLWLELCVAICLIVEGATLFINMLTLRIRLNRARREAEKAGLLDGEVLEAHAEER